MRPLGICWIGYGIFRVCLGVALVFFAPTATVMFGALLGRVPNPYWLMGLFHVLYGLAIVVSVLCGVLGIAGGGLSAEPLLADGVVPRALRLGDRGVSSLRSPGNCRWWVECRTLTG